MQNNPMGGGDLGAGGVSRYMSSFIPQQPQQQPQQQQPGSSFLPQSAPGSLYPSGFNSGRGMQQPMNSQYGNRPPAQGSVAPSTHLQRGGSAGNVNHRGLNSLGGLGVGGSIGGVGAGQVSVGLSMPGRGGSSMQPQSGQQQQGRGSMLGGPMGAMGLSVGGRSTSAPSFATNSSAYGGSVGLASMGSHGGEVESHQPHIEPNFGAEDFPTLGGNMGGSRTVHDMPMSSAVTQLAAQKINPDSSFHMASEDFPSLSQPKSAEKSMVNNAFSAISLPNASSSSGSQNKPIGPSSTATSEQATANASPFGLLGLLNVIHLTSADLNTLALGTDLTTLGLNLNSTEPLYHTFASPWADQPCRREPDFSLPPCYYMQPPTLKPGHIHKFQLETLFYIFYMMPKDTLQAVAASELHSRDWKFHSELGMWFCKQPESGKGFGRPSTYVYFDVKVWDRRTYVDNNKNLEQGFLADEEVNVQFSQHK